MKKKEVSLKSNIHFPSLQRKRTSPLEDLQCTTLLQAHTTNFANHYAGALRKTEKPSPLPNILQQRSTETRNLHILQYTEGKKIKPRINL